MNAADSSAMRVGIVGLGGAAKQMLPSFRSHPNVRITAAADPRPEARKAFADEFGAAVFADARSLCASPDVDVVYIATPHQLHKEHAIEAARAGKHIIVEKPMALSLDECSAMVEAADKHAVLLLVGHTHSFDAPVIKMREIIRAGRIGPVAMINSWNFGSFLYRPRRPEELRTEEGGGIIYNQVPHQVDVVRLLGGGLVRSVRSMVWTLDPARPTEGAHATFLQFDDGAAATLAYSGYDHFDSDEFHFWVGELGEPKPADRHGSARASLARLAGVQDEINLKAAGGFGGDKQLQAPPRDAWNQPHFGVTIVTGAQGDLRQSARGVLIYGAVGKEEIELPRPRCYPDKCGVIDEMYAAFTGKRSLIHDGAWGLATMEVCEAILRSAQERREITLKHQTSVRD